MEEIDTANKTNNPQSGLNRQELFVRALAKMFVDNKLPLHHTENASLREVFAVADPKLKVPSRPALVKEIDLMYEEYQNIMMQQLAKIKNIVMTTDLWTSFGKSFLGATIHWINPKTLEREYKALACRRMEGLLLNYCY